MSQVRTGSALAWIPAVQASQLLACAARELRCAESRNHPALCISRTEGLATPLRSGQSYAGWVPLTSIVVFQHEQPLRGVRQKFCKALFVLPYICVVMEKTAHLQALGAALGIGVKGYWADTDVSTPLQPRCRHCHACWAACCLCWQQEHDCVRYQGLCACHVCVASIAVVAMHPSLSSLLCIQPPSAGCCSFTHGAAQPAKDWQLLSLCLLTATPSVVSLRHLLAGGRRWPSAPWRRPPSPSTS